MKGSARFACSAIRLYQRISPALGPHCRFIPSCSEYTRQAIQRHGLWRGVTRGLFRLLRCHPGSAGGLDPVPSSHCERSEAI